MTLPSVETFPVTTVPAQPNRPVALPTPSSTELARRFAQGQKRHGILGVFVTVEGHGRDVNIVLFEHKASDKAPHASLGVMGETSKVYRPTDGHIEIEPSGATLLRGIREEVGLSVPASELRLPLLLPFYNTLWPVGKNYPGKFGGALCPLIVLSSDVAQSFVEAPATEEISARRLVPLAEAHRQARLAEAEGSEIFRPGMVKFLSETTAMLNLTSLNERHLGNLDAVEWERPAEHTYDANLEALYGAA